MLKSVLPLMYVLLVLSLIPAAAPRVEAQDDANDPALRLWKSREGNFQTIAAMIESDGTVVRLKKRDGQFVSIPIDKLCDADQSYIKSQSDNTDASNVKVPIAADAAGTAELESKCRDLCEQITRGYNGKAGGGKPVIAVVEFSNLSGGVTNLGRLLSEELITRLFATGNYKVIERLLLNKAIAEHRLQLQGLVDPKSAKELGKILGVDSIVSGTIADVGDSLRVNARLISTETGEVLSVAAASMSKDNLSALVGDAATALGATYNDGRGAATNRR